MQGRLAALADDPIDREEVARITGRGRWALALGLGCVMGSLAAFDAAYRLHVEADMLDLYESALSDDLEPHGSSAPRPGQRGYLARLGRQRYGDGNLAAAVGALLLPVAFAAFAVRRSRSRWTARADAPKD